MKKILFLLLCTVSIYGQTYQNPTFGTITTKTAPTSTTPPTMATIESVGTIGKITPINIPISIVPTNYAPTAPTLGGHLIGIDDKLGHLTNTTAGVTTRVWFTADQTTITAGIFDLTNPLNKGTVASHQQTVANDDGQKKYFTTDVIGQPFAMATTFPIGLYAGNLSASTTPTNANQKFTVELYKCNNAGTPIASGVTGAPVGSLGVTVIMILDSGEVTLANASVTNVAVSTILGSAFNIAVGERIRYHVSSEKVGTAGGIINESVYYGNSYNSFIDVPVIYNSTSIKDVSTVTAGVGTVTDALNTLNTGKEAKFTTNNVIPKGSASGLVNSSISDSGTGVGGIVNINNFIGGTVTRVLPSGSTTIGSSYTLTNTDATSSFTDRKFVNFSEDGFGNSGTNQVFQVRTGLNKTTNQGGSYIGFASQIDVNSTANYTALIGNRTSIVGNGTGALTNAYLYQGYGAAVLNTFSITNFTGLDLLFNPQNNVTSAWGVRIGELYGSTLSRGIDTNVSSGTGKYNIYAQGTASNYFNGDLLVGTSTPNGNKFRLSGTAELITVPTTSAVTPDFVTRNKTTGVLEKIDGANVVQGTGANGQVAFWNSANTQTGDSGFVWDNTSKALAVGTNFIAHNAKLTVGGKVFLPYTGGTDIGGIIYGYNDTSVASFEGGLKFQTYKLTGGVSYVMTDAVTINGQGNVGIGTTSPLEKLHVVGNIRASSLAGTGTRQVVADASGVLSATSPLPLKYRASLTQVGTNAPIVTVMENSIGAIVWSYVSPGIYDATLSGAFTAGKTFILTNDRLVFQAEADLFWVNSSTLRLNTINPSGVYSDSILSALMYVDITVYP